MIQIEPERTHQLLRLANIYEQTRATTSWPSRPDRRPRKAEPNDPAVYMQLAGFYNRQGDFDKTIEALNERTKIEPNNPEASTTPWPPTTGTRPIATSDSPTRRR